MRRIAALALMLGPAAGAAEPAEPLTITRLPDAEKDLLVSAASDNAPDFGTDQFSRAISDALRDQQRSTQTHCKAEPTANSPVAARWAWEARCRYKRY